MASAFPPGLILLMPAFVVLGYRAYYELRVGEPTLAVRRQSGETRDGQPAVAGAATAGSASQEDEPARTPTRKDPNAIMIIVALLVWLGTFLALHLSQDNTDSLPFFHTALGVPLYVPVMGFLGSVVFVADLFRSGREDFSRSKEFAMRLVLGPYVAIVMVMLTDNFGLINQAGTEVSSRATLAFFSGFLVVLALQALSERGNELLGRWRARYRYEPSEVAKAFDLPREMDLQLKGVGLQKLRQLRTLSLESLRERAKLAGLDLDFVRTLQKETGLVLVRRQLSEETWGILRKHGVETVRDLALLETRTVDGIAEQEALDKQVLKAFQADCRQAAKIM